MIMTKESNRFYNCLRPTKIFHNFDNSRIHVLGVLPSVKFFYNKKSAIGACFVADVPFSFLGMDTISALRLTISVEGSSEPDPSSGAPLR